MKKLNTNLVVVLVVMFTFALAGLVKGATTVDLGTAEDFAILAGSTITNTGSSVIEGDLGLSPGSSVTGFPPGTVDGEQEIDNVAAEQAKDDLVTAYLDAKGQTPVSTIPTELGGTTRTAGIYDSAAGTFGITGTLTLDAVGDPDAVFIFKTESTLITAGSSRVVLVNGAQSCNVFWQVGSSATLGTDSSFVGNILALTSITLTTGAEVDGRVLARNGAVTLDTNVVTSAICASPEETEATLTVIKRVINDNGGSAISSQFDVHVTITGTDVAGSPADGVKAPGRSYTLAPGRYKVSEDANASYTQSISGDCNLSGFVDLHAGESLVCTITNNDIAGAASSSSTLTGTPTSTPGLPNTGIRPDDQ